MGTQRLFSVKYLFGQENIAQNFLLLDDDRFLMHNARLILSILYDFLEGKLFTFPSGLEKKETYNVRIQNTMERGIRKILTFELRTLNCI